MIGLELQPSLAKLSGDPTKTQSVRFANILHAAGLLTIPAGANILRLLPPLNLREIEAQEGLKLIETAIAQIAG
jgi:acetylornithine/succinyldiaminopimelate/putrescine aminotransferase